MKALIIGAGIGGLTTAIALKQRGIDFEIFEGAEELRAVGAGIWLGANAMHMYEKLGIADKIKAESVFMEKVYIKDFKGKILQKIDNKLILKKYGHATHSIQRATLQKILANEINNDIRLGKKCVNVDNTKEGVFIIFADGTQVSGDLLIGADGIRSETREQNITNVEYRYSGQACWRATINMNLPEEERNESAEVWGNKGGLRASYSQAGNNQVYFWFTKSLPAGLRPSKEAGLQMIKEDLASFSGNMNMVVNNIQADNLIYNDLYDFKPINAWYKDRIVLLGDAAHATTPNLGQGASQAIEDAYVLAACLSTNQNLEEALVYYQSLRLKRAKKIVETSFLFARVTNYKSGFARFIRNTVIKYTPDFITSKQFKDLYDINYPF